MPRVAAEGGDGLGLGDLVPAALAMGFVVGVDSAVLSVADSAELAGSGVTKVAVLDCLESGPAMAERLADERSPGQHDDVPDAGMVVMEGVVDMVQAHSDAPAKWPVLVAFAQWFGDEFSDLFEHRNSSPAVHRRV